MEIIHSPENAAAQHECRLSGSDKSETVFVRFADT